MTSGATKLFILLYLLFTCNTLVTAQYIISPTEFTNFDYNIKQIDEFFLRFNLNEILIQPNDNDQYTKQNRILLFDKDYYYANTNTISEFLDAIESQNVTLHFQDTTWYAIAECNVILNGRTDKLTLTLKTENITKDTYKWCIANVAGNIVQLEPKTTSDKLRILPTDNEVNFLSLKSITTTNSQNITLFTSNRTNNDALSVFNALVYYKLLKIENVQQLTYCFTQVKGYKFFVKKFTRDEKNAGWLIYNITKESVNKETNKDEVLRSMQIVTLFYERLTTYATEPQNVTLAYSIRKMFLYEPTEPYVFGENQIYNDLDEYTSMVSVAEYLHSIENLACQGVNVSYEISDFNIISINDSSIVATYQIVVQKGFRTDSYKAEITLNRGLIKSIHCYTALE